MMVAGQLRFSGLELLNEVARLAPYMARGEERAAYRRAFGAQAAVIAGGRCGDGQCLGSDLQMTVKDW
jgi:hypothetical protein